ncbi:MAG: hypothetical protein K2X82_21835 [Gemmataceae bacterium]|nr:hypothetical protein [Gemmataceae bacterium]
MDESAPFPRLFGITAPAAGVVAVVERRPRGWWRVGRWDPTAGRYEPGAWFRGRLYPQRCDLSPDGRYFAYFALKPGSDWAAGETYTAVSRLPWLKALAAWGESGTYSRGAHFRTDTAVWDRGPPTVGDAGPLRARYSLGWTRAAQFAVERRRGWQESADTPPRADDDGWDQARDVVMEKPCPVGDRPAVLSVRGKFAAFRELPNHWPPADSGYTLTRGRESWPLAGVKWADWDAAGRLLVATWDGRLRVQKPDRPGTVVSEVRLGDDEPARGPAPAWADEW